MKKEFGKRLVADIGPDDVLEYRRDRLADGASNRTVNYEVGCLRGVLKRCGLWARVIEQIPRLKLRENENAGRALSADHDRKLLDACQMSKAPSLLPLYTISIDAGLRASEVKALRHRDLNLKWKDGCILSGELIVSRSKTDAGRGRSIPLTAAVCSVLTLWLSRFPQAKTDSYVFPRHGVVMLKGGTETRIVSVQLDEPVQSWMRAWRTALRQAGLCPAGTRPTYRWHDLRHTFVTRLCENPRISEQTIMALAGHVSKKMLERYSHIRTRPKQEAIAALHLAREKSFSDRAQKWAQSEDQRDERGDVSH